MTDYVWVVKVGDRYLANRLHRMAWTKTLIRAQTYLTQDAAETYAAAWKGAAVLIELKEITVE